MYTEYKYIVNSELNSSPQLDVFLKMMAQYIFSCGSNFSNLTEQRKQMLHKTVCNFHQGTKSATSSSIAVGNIQSVSFRLCVAGGELKLEDNVCRTKRSQFTEKTIHFRTMQARPLK